MKVVVIDASVVVGFCLAESTAVEEAARQLFTAVEDKKLRLLAPELLKAEVANALRFSSLTDQDIETVLAHFLRLPIKWLTVSDQLMLAAVRLARAVNDSVYDSLYHTIALSHDATYYTLDHRYYRRARQWGRIELLEVSLPF